MPEIDGYKVEARIRCDAPINYLRYAAYIGFTIIGRGGRFWVCREVE